MVSFPQLLSSPASASSVSENQKFPAQSKVLSPFFRAHSLSSALSNHQLLVPTLFLEVKIQDAEMGQGGEFVQNPDCPAGRDPEGDPSRCTMSSLEAPCLLSHSVMSNLCDPMDCSPPGSSVHGILQARILEWVARPSYRRSS